ncbi:nitrogen regulatory protein P-II family [Halanaerobium saccharolyticum]|uniref:Nitrogen regulatory protein P-II family n=1 Tax=Halanaerobium saccharolyticum TaxID=43595 RepID=A0A4V6Q883_9FIRM|nr:P-II family nitrogen regulator [Halanaerobium saccharolyticum]RAK11788.1 nitrogen regulatory protein P-II family [Halanaerobium saccharolyticum]TDW07629.1 nitrogen regulatory protein P-II family [Halanaerobium saccharolyticum]TDX64550.1 nitrogen regulatory protein P-II family [Halanaerobium saccharolyticum]
MKLLQAIIRPEKSSTVLSELKEAGFPAVTKMDVAGRGKQRGVKVGNIHYDELPKELLMMVLEDEDKEDVVKIIMKTVRSGKEGSYGDGKIFVSDVEEAYTISSNSQGL